MGHEVRSGFVEVDGGRVFYEAAGSGPAVVLVHGGMWDRRMWDDQFVEFAQQHSVVRYDVRGFGRSDPPTAPYRNHEDLHALLRALGIERITPVGLSMGGSVVLDFAVEHPEAIEALVVASCGIGGHSEWSEEVRGSWDREETAVEAGDPTGALQGQLDFWTPPGEDPDVDRRLRDVAFDNLKIYDIPDGLSERAAPPVIGRLSAIEVPTLVVVGERDVTDIHRMADRMTAEIPGARKVVIPRADHLPNARAPREFNRAVLEFLLEVVR